MTSAPRGPSRLSLLERRAVQRYGQLTAALSLVLSACAPQQGSPGVPQPAMPHNYSHLETEVLNALNRARTNPRGTAIDLQDLIPFFKGNLFQRPEQPMPVQTNEGAAAVRQAVTDVSSRLVQAEVTLDPSLTAAARDQVNDQSHTGNVGHTGSDGSNVESRVSRYAWWRVSLSENIDYSPAVHGSWVIQSLLIDDGVADRGHRANIYSTTAKVVGIACGPHPRYGGMCVIVQAGGITPK